MIKLYTCAYCNKAHETPVKRAQCEIQCEKLKKEEEAAKYCSKLKKEKENSEQMLKNEFKALAKKLWKYKNTYKKSLSLSVGAEDGTIVRCDIF